MYILTGRLIEDGKEIAYGVYDTEKKRAMLMARKEIRKMVEHGLNVLGFEKVYNTIGNFLAIFN